MRPEELRAAADVLDREVFSQVHLTPEQYDAANVAHRAMTQLAAVLEMHKPTRPGIYAEEECWNCHDYSTDPIEWPCPTAVAALGEETAFQLKYERGEAKA